MPFYVPGTITVERLYAIICGICNDEDTAPPDRAYAERSFRERGWSKTVKHGWICHKCKAQKRNHAD